MKICNGLFKETRGGKSKGEMNQKQSPISSDLMLFLNLKGKKSMKLFDYFIARSEPFRAVEDHFFRQMVYRMHRGYTLKLMSEMELARKIDAKIEQKPLLTIALKILKTIEKPLVPMVGPPKKHSMVMVQLCQNH